MRSEDMARSSCSDRQINLMTGILCCSYFLLLFRSPSSEGQFFCVLADIKRSHKEGSEGNSSLTPCHGDMLQVAACSGFIIACLACFYIFRKIPTNFPFWTLSKNQYAFYAVFSNPILSAPMRWRRNVQKWTFFLILCGFAGFFLVFIFIDL